MEIPQFQDVLQAHKRIQPYLARPPLHSYPALNALIKTEVYVKHENYQPVGAFKSTFPNTLDRLNIKMLSSGMIFRPFDK